MKRPFAHCCTILACTTFLLASFPEATHAESEASDILLPRASRTFSGDLDAMRKRRMVRVLVSYSRTDFFVDAGRPRGFECELFLEYEKFLNTGVSRRDFQMNVVFVPVPFDQLVPSLVQGKGDVAAAGLTVTPQREKLAGFTDPYLTGVDEIVVTSKNAKPVKTLWDLSGRKVHVPKGSSYVLHLQRLNQELAKRGRKPIRIFLAGRNLETEDLLELVNAGIFELTVSDRHIAELWSSVFTNMVLRRDLKVHAGGRIAWAVRKNNPQLLASLNAFVSKNKKGTLIGNILFKRYYENAKWVRNPLTAAERKKLEQYRSFFQKYGEQYGFDWLLLAAQGYQESRLDQSTRSRSGAIGIMQLLPSTAKYVGISNIYDPENNIHAGTKYMDYLRKKFFNDPGISPEAKWDFSLAAYNAGPNRVQRWREKAKASGLDPNRWFYNVERIALQEVGQETVQYVGNINKYYIAYRSVYQIVQERTKQKPS